MKYSNGVWTYDNGLKSCFSIEELIENGKKYRKEIAELKRLNEHMSKNKLCFVGSCQLVGRLQLKIDRLLAELKGRGK
jgi:NADH:ubiquinone oxidoreductase subunit F (NADH-binding)